MMSHHGLWRGVLPARGEKLLAEAMALTALFTGPATVEKALHRVVRRAHRLLALSGIARPG